VEAVFRGSPPILQAWWDREGVHSPLLVILCGSQLSTMEILGKESAPLLGRFNAGIIQLMPLHYEDVGSFYFNSPHYGLADILLMYGVFGGTPRYHALVDTSFPPAHEIVTLLMQPHAPLENEVRFLLSSEQIRDPAPYNAILAAIANGETQFSRIQQLIGVERGALSASLRTLRDLGWICRELPFGEHSDRRALYRISDPFLAFWYRFIAPLASPLQFSDPRAVFDECVAPRLSEYMGWSVFVEICKQWLKRYAKKKLGLNIRQLARYWGRDGHLEIDLMAELDHGEFLFGECKWRADSMTNLSDLITLQAKVANLPEARWRSNPKFVIFTVGSFAPEFKKLSADRHEQIFLVSGKNLFS
jgi:hypothetical protein